MGNCLWCTRPRAIGLACRKCFKRLDVIRHNATLRNRQEWWKFPSGMSVGSGFPVNPEYKSAIMEFLDA